MKILLIILGIIGIVLALFALIVVLILLIPVTLSVSYRDKKAGYTLRILGIKLNLPSKLPKKKKKKSKSANQQKKKKNNTSLIDTLADVRRIILPLTRRAANAITVKKLYLKAKISTNDPCDTAIIYGLTNAAVYATLTLLEEHVKVQSKDVSVVASYDDTPSDAELELVVHTLIFKIIHALILLSSDGIIDLPK